MASYNPEEIRTAAQKLYLSFPLQEGTVEQDLNGGAGIGDEPANCC